MNILLKDVTLQVKTIKEKDKLLRQLLEFHKETVSVQFFLHCTFQIHYQQTHLCDHDYYDAHDMFLAPIEQLHDHNYCIKQDKNTIIDYIIDQQYADDIGFMSINKNIISKTMKNIALI